MTEAARQRLGRRVRARRRELGLTAADAAAAAEMSPKTWAALEDGTRATRDSKYAGIERALQWTAGSVERILNGCQPTDAGTPQDPHFVDPATGEEYVDENERQVWAIATMDPEERRQLIYIIRANRAGGRKGRRAG